MADAVATEIRRLHRIIRQETAGEGLIWVKIDRHALDVIASALRGAEDEIHNPGCARFNNYDILDLIDQAKKLVAQAKTGDSTQGIPG